MVAEDIHAELLRGYKIFDFPEDATLVALRLDTENQQWFCLVSREILLKLSDALAEEADKLEPLQ